MWRLVNRIIDHLEEWLIAALLAVATSIVFLAVVHRFASGVPVLQPFTARIDMGWAEELSIFMIVWMAKFGAAYGVRMGTHVGVDVLVNRLAPAKRRIVVTAGLIGGVVFTAVIGTLGANFVWQLAGTDQTSDQMEVPVWIVYLCIPLGSYLMCFRFVQIAWRYWRTGEIPHRDHGHVEGVDASALDLSQLGGDAGTGGGGRP